MPKAIKKPAVSAAGVLSNSDGIRLEHRPSRMGMMMMVVPRDGRCHKPGV
jgi:hypothetical protein